MTDDEPTTLAMVPVNNVERATVFTAGAESDVVLDALPYVDHVHPDYEAYALSLIEREMQVLPPAAPPMTDMPTFLGREISRKEYEDLAVRREGRPRSIPDSSMDSPQSDDDGEAWKRCVRAAKIELESQRSRLLNLQLQTEHESSLWVHHNSTLESTHLHPLQNTLLGQRHVVDTINANRMELQEKEAAPTLFRLESRFQQLIDKQRRLAIATALLEDEVFALKRNNTSGSDLLDRDETNQQTDDDDNK